ncbi:DUF4394 domain-containing protein [Geitlerinema splendidum]|nr:DUF4394 domain-containing protein [Geitlerinema splendidum]
MLINGVNIADGTTTAVAFGATTVGTPATTTITINNTGTAPLNLSNLTLPEGFSLVGTLPSTVAAGGTTSFDVRLDADAIGTPSGELSFITNDSDENPFNFQIQGTVVAAVSNAFALTTENTLVAFNTAAPGSILDNIEITGLQANESLLGIDFRPADGQLYALGSTNQIYTINTTTGAVTAVGDPLTPAVMGTGQGFDFNPVPDRIRVVNDSNQNLRLNPDTGEAIVDGTLAFADGDANFGVDPAIVSAAYTNNRAGVTSTMLYGIDFLRDVLVLQSPPNDGVLNTVGTGLGVNVNEFTSFDIRTMGATNEAFAAIREAIPTGIAPDGTSASSLYSIDLTAGTATLIGSIGDGLSIVGLALPIVPNAYALTSDNQLLGFNTTAPEAILSTVNISGLAEGESLLGIDFRPADGQLYALGSTSQIYTIDTMTGTATAVGVPLSPTVMGMGQGFDFNPVPDRIRVVNDSNQNLRLNPETGEAIVDGTLIFADGDANFGVDPAIVSAAYTNSIAGATTTALYGIDFLRDVLVLQNPPNDGILNTIGTGLGVNVNEFTSFDIRTMGTTNEAFAAIREAIPTGIASDGTSASSLYSIDLTAGTATLVGTIGVGVSVTGLALPIF